MKLYINAGTDTYELARIFSDACKKLGKDPQMKVAIGNMQSEIKRNEKLCIYIEDMEQAKQYIEVLEAIRKEKPQFKFESPMLTAGTIDNWIGVGSDISTSYNAEICNILMDSFDRHFSNMSRQQIIEQIKRNPAILETVRQTVKDECLRNGRSPDKMCVRNDDVQALGGTVIGNYVIDGKGKEISVGATRTTKPIEEIYEKEIKPEEISAELMQSLRKNGYDGKSGHPVLQAYYKLYCETEDGKHRREVDGKKIAELQQEYDRQSDRISALKDRGYTFENIIKKQMGNAQSIWGTLRTVSKQVEDLRTNARGKSFLERLREGFTRKKQYLLPATTQCETIEMNGSNVLRECDFMKKFEKQNMPLGVGELMRGRARARVQERMVTERKKAEIESGLELPDSYGDI